MLAYWRKSSQFLLFYFQSRERVSARAVAKIATSLHLRHRGRVGQLIGTGARTLAAARILGKVESILVFISFSRPRARSRVFAKTATSLHLGDGGRAGYLICRSAAGASGMLHMAESRVNSYLFYLLFVLSEKTV